MVLAQPILAGPADFVFTIDTRFTSGDETFTIPTYGVGYKYDVDCDDDGVFEAQDQSTAYTCDYSVSGGGEKTIVIRDSSGDGSGFPRIRFSEFGEEAEVIELNNWGSGIWDSMNGAFFNAQNMVVTASDVPDLSQVLDMRSMFYLARLANPNTSAWDTSNVTNMRNMFRAAISANPNTSAWNTGNVRDMAHMFSMEVLGGIANPDTSGWDTGNVTDMSWMFQANVMANPDTSGWNTANVTNMQVMFAAAQSANPDTSNWDITAVTDMSDMFTGVTLPTDSYDAMLMNFSKQVVQSGVNFHGGDSTYCIIGPRNTLINNFQWSIVDGGQNPLCTISSDDLVIQVDTRIIGSSTSLNTQFEIRALGAGLNYNVDCDVANPQTNTAMALTSSYTCSYVNPGIYTIRIEDNVGDGTGFPQFSYGGVSDVKKILDIVQWGNIQWATMMSAFWNAENLRVSAIDVPDFSQISTFRSMFLGAVLADPDTRDWDTSSATDMLNMFRSAEAANPDTSGWDTSNVTNMTSMFSGAVLANPDVSGWNTSSVTEMSFMFANTTANPDTSGWDITAVTNMQGMFANVTLPTASYEAMLAGFSTQAVQMGVEFDGGNSMYCDTTARDILINDFGWIITDGGPLPECDVIYKNSFDVPVENFVAKVMWFEYDFEQLETVELDSYPALIGVGLDQNDQAIIKFHIRKMDDQLQIRISDLDQEAFEPDTWIEHQWQNFNSSDLTEINWLQF